MMIHHVVIQSSTIGVLPVEKHSKEEIKTTTFKVRSSQNITNTNHHLQRSHVSRYISLPNIFFEPELKAWVIGSGDVLYISPTFKDLKQWQMADFLNYHTYAYIYIRIIKHLSFLDSHFFPNFSLRLTSTWGSKLGP